MFTLKILSETNFNRYILRKREPINNNNDYRIKKKKLKNISQIYTWYIVTDNTYLNR